MIKKIMLAPDSFKGSLTALEVAEALAEGLSRVGEWELVKIPVADGGEGTVQSLVDAFGGELVWTEVTGPLGEPVQAFYGVVGDGETCVIEMAAASGLPLVPVLRRNPLITTTFGTGELIKAGLNRGCGKFIIGIGGSATNDGGMGMAQALGVRFLDEAGQELSGGGGELVKLARIDLEGLDARVRTAQFQVACDVANPLYGPKGAAWVYGPQKGATPEMVQVLDQGLHKFAQIVQRDVGIKVADVPGAGAAGGLGAGLLAFLRASLRPGAAIVLDAVGFQHKVQAVDLVITGEGKIDSQTIFGKTPIGVARAAKAFGKPVIAIAGTIGEGAGVVHDNGIDLLYTIVKGPTSLAEAIANSYVLVADLGEEIGRMLKLMNKSGIIGARCNSTGGIESLDN